jgi:hypothetical protein
MRRISSRVTFLHKRIFPAIWFGFILLGAVVAVTQGLGADRLEFLPFLIVLVLMAGVGYAIMKKLVFDLVDEVWDDGDVLIVRNKGQEDRVALSDVMNVSYSPLVSPPRVTLSLRNPSIFGNHITFSAPIRFVPFAASPIIQELIERIDAKRRA